MWINTANYNTTTVIRQDQVSMERSFLHTPTTAEPEYVSVAEKLDQYAAQIPEEEANVFYTKSDTPNKPLRTHITYRTLSEKSYQLASALLDFGLKPGDRIAISGPPSPEWLYFEYAVLRIKVLLVRPPTTLMMSDNIHDFLEKFKCRILVVDPDDEAVINAIKPLILTICEDKKKTALDNDKNDAYLETVLLTKHVEEFDDVLALDELLDIQSDVKFEAVKQIMDSVDLDDDIAVVFPTSGSTGFPKLVAFPNQAAIEQMEVIGMASTFGELSADGRVTCFINRPYSWGAGMPMMSGIIGWKSVCIDSSVTAEFGDMQVFFDMLEKESIRIAFLPVFMMYDAMKKHIKFPTCLKYLLTAGESVPEPVLRSMLGFFRRVFIMYACTEAFGTITSGILEEDGSVESSARYRPYPNCKVKIVDESGQVVPVGKPGSIWICSYMTHFMHYLDNPEATKEIKTQSGWVNTEDAGIIHPGGFLQVIGRTSDAISKGGIKVYPITIENMLIKHPKVSKAVVYAVPDDRVGQEIMAWIVAKENSVVSAEDLKAYCKEHGTKVYEVELYPTDFKIVDSLPMLPNGKVNRKAIQDQMLQLKK